MFWRRIAVSLIVSISLASAQSASKAASAIESETNVDRIVANLERSGLAKDPEIGKAAQAVRTAPPNRREAQLEHLRSLVKLVALREASPPTGRATEAAREIKRSPLYRDPGITESSNWLSRALERLANLLKRPDRDRPEWQMPRIGPWLTWLAWTLLGVAVVVFAYFVARHYQWRLNLSRKASAILEEDEPERTADEWLEMADKLEAQGDFRRAVRCLYLACLLRFDETGVGRFDRGQTNWEHLERLSRSPRMPAQIDFRTPTKAFDVVWYGKIVRGAEDVSQFRQVYADVKQATEAVPA
ncbi:MAG TPA: DUF4129 domain-containing protein [Fimbriimonas sp.]